MSLVFCCSFLISIRGNSWFNLTLNVMQKVEIPCLPKKKRRSILVSPSERELGTTPSLEVLVWYPVCTCYGISVTVRLCLKLKPNVCSALREVNCMLAIWSRVKDLRQACDMKCKSVLNFFLFFYGFLFFSLFFLFFSSFFYLMLRVFFKDQLVILVL